MAKQIDTWVQWRCKVPSRRVQVTLFVMVLAGTTWLTADAVSAQTQKSEKEPGARTWLAERAKLPPFNPPRMADGKPNLQGFWDGIFAGDDLEEVPEEIDRTTPAAESRIGDPPDGKIPYQPWALGERARHRYGLGRGWPGEAGQRLYADPQGYCLLGVPRPAQRGFELVQTPELVVWLLGPQMAYGYYRTIPVSDRPHMNPGAAKLWMGIARARWDADTLVIDTRYMNGKMWLDSAGNFFSENARVIERLRMVDMNTLDYQATIEDPSVFTRPWTINAPLRRRQFRDGDAYARENWEAACNEGNGNGIEDLQSLGFKWFRGITPLPVK